MKKIPLVRSPRFYRSMLIVMGSALLSFPIEATYTHMSFVSYPAGSLSPAKGAYDQFSDPDKQAFMELVHIANLLELGANDHKITNSIIHLNRPASFYETYSKLFDPKVIFFVSFQPASPGKRGIGPETGRYLKDFFKDAGVFVSEKPGSVMEITGGSEVRDTFLPETYHLRIKSHISVVAVKPRTDLSEEAYSTLTRHDIDLDYAVKTFIQRPTRAAVPRMQPEPASLDRPWLESKSYYLHHHSERYPPDTFVVPEAKDVLEDNRNRSNPHP